jgi:hypothetical protein
LCSGKERHFFDPGVVLRVKDSGLYRLTGKSILKNSGKKVVQTQRE